MGRALSYPPARPDEYVRLGQCRPWLPYGNFTTGSANAFKTGLSWMELEFAATTSGLAVVAKGITRPGGRGSGREGRRRGGADSNYGGAGSTVRRPPSPSCRGSL